MLKTMIKLEINPKNEHIDQIKKWLTEEWNENKNGFLTNWDIILEAYTEKRLSLLTDNGIAIGFAVYRIYNELAIIDIVEIKPIKRKKGIARKFILDTFESFKSNSVLVVKLFCAPEISEGFWSKCGFQKFDIPKNNKINMYKVLVSDLKPSEKTQANDTLKLWDCEPYQIVRNEPKWIWNLKFKSDNKTLINPIIFPAFKDWQLELTKNGVKIKNKVKHFPLDISFNGTFMIIREISK
jgi:predicted GNAT family acetyltransferase